MAAFSSIYPYVTTEVIGCPDPMVDQAIRSAAREFCRETMCWDEVTDPVPLDTTGAIDLLAPQGAVVGEVRDVWVGTRRLRPVTLDELQQVLPAWRTATSNSPLYYNEAPTRDSLSVYPIPDGTSTDTLVTRLSYVPSLSCTTLPDFLADRYIDTIAAGAKSRLMAIVGQAWSNPQLAAAYMEAFRGGVIDAKAAELHARVPGLVQARPRPFGF